MALLLPRKDKKTGHDISLFCVRYVGFSTQLGRPLMPLFFAWRQSDRRVITTTLSRLGSSISGPQAQLRVKYALDVRWEGFAISYDTPAAVALNHPPRQRARLTAITRWTSPLRRQGAVISSAYWGLEHRLKLITRIPGDDGLTTTPLRDGDEGASRSPMAFTR